MRFKTFASVLLLLSLLLCGCGAEEAGLSFEVLPDKGLSYYPEALENPGGGSLIVSAEKIPQGTTVYVCLFNELFPGDPIMQDELSSSKLSLEFPELSSSYSYQLAAGLIGGDKPLELRIEFR